mmetsp:Transcript_12935/g.6389  ORF Transcript_12935/g.6389 Transcript_12935/m.6389 type:complete len:224 (-) Transcript_12935:268-939(-)
MYSGHSPVCITKVALCIHSIHILLCAVNFSAVISSITSAVICFIFVIPCVCVVFIMQSAVVCFYFPYKPCNFVFYTIPSCGTYIKLISVNIQFGKLVCSTSCIITTEVFELSKSRDGNIVTILLHLQTHIQRHISKCNKFFFCVVLRKVLITIFCYQNIVSAVVIQLVFQDYYCVSFCCKVKSVSYKIERGIRKVPAVKYIHIKTNKFKQVKVKRSVAVVRRL